MSSPTLPSPLQQLHAPLLKEAGVTVYLKRDDLIHPDIPGNKWRKLRYNLQAAKEQGATTLLTFGGAYSNHLRAVAAAGRLFGFSTIGVVRGEEHTPLNWSLAYAASQGMQLHYTTRTAYRQKHSSQFIQSLRHQFGDFYLLPEGGSNELAVRGCREISQEIDIPFDIICCSVGTGGTLAGVAADLQSGQKAIGFSSLKGGEFLSHDVATLQQTALGRATSNWHIETSYHFGGFAKTNPELQQFITDFQEQYGVLLERIYVAKMLFGIFDLIEKGYFSPGTVVIALVTGPAEAP